MTDAPPPEREEYDAEEIGHLQMIWGDGFLSPGGAAEVSRVVGGHDLTGRDVVDVGCGLGGAALVLVREHGARTVTGLDVVPALVDQAADRARRAGLSDRISFRLAQPTSLDLHEASFDAVFSKDAVIHVPDKERLLREMHAALRPGGLLLLGDWLRGHGEDHDADVADLVNATGGSFHMASLEDMAAIARRAGFAEVETEDRRDWYLAEARAERERLRGGHLADAFRARWGDEALGAESEFWDLLVAMLEAGSLRPGHIRARRPATGD